VLQQWRRDVRPDECLRAEQGVRDGVQQVSGTGQGFEHLKRGGGGEDPEHPGDRGGEPGQGDEPAQAAARLGGLRVGADIGVPRLSTIVIIEDRNNENRYVKG
jgi:hypothetical protein